MIFRYRCNASIGYPILLPRVLDQRKTVRAITRFSTLVAPARLSARASSFKVAPVVMTSSSTATLAPERSSLPAHVFRALLVGKFRLRRRVLDAQHAARLDRCPQIPRETAGDLESLIEPTRGEALGVQRHRKDHVDIGQRPGREAAGEESRERELSAILERLHESVARKFVAPQCERRVEVRGTFEASPAHRRGGTGKGAPGARFGEHGQFADAIRAERLGPGSRPAEQAVFAGPGKGASSAAVQ